MNTFQTLIAALTMASSAAAGFQAVEPDRLVDSVKQTCDIANKIAIKQAIDIYLLKTSDYSIVSMESSEQLIMLKNAQIIN